MKGKTRIEMISSFLMKLKDKAAVLALALVMVLGLAGMPVETKAAVGDTPPHYKSLTDNHDGTYTLSLDVVGDSEKKPNNINVIVIVDTSGSMTQTRMTAAKNAVNSLANALYAYNTQSEPDTVEMALVRFATSSSVARTPTNSLAQFRTAVNGLGNQGNGGTNWESALQTANGVDFGDEDQTFAIFVSDGNPTFRTTQNGWNDWSYQYQQWGSGQETATNIQRCYTTAVDDAAALATKVTPGNFFTIGAFGNVDRMEQLTDDAGSDSSTNYYSASDTAALNKAIADILAKIEMAGIANTEIDDGTTNKVTTTSGEVAELLEVDESSYKYYRSGGTYGSMAPWADAPEAELVNGTVEWDLSSVGVLENGVRYTVTFDVYPSQYTYDTIAKLKNGDITYDSLDAEVKKYIVDNGGGDYSLRTNTNASLSWDDTRDDAGQQTDAYVNPDPVGTNAQQLTVNKEWEGADPDVTELPITVMMGDEEFHTATLSAANNWETSSYISVGIIKNGQALPGALGHDFSFAELDDTQYRWELDAPTVRPMLVNGTLTMLIKVDADHPAPSGATTYTIEGSTYYVDSAASGLTATNYRRSNLNLTKTVTGEDAPEDATFPFTLTVNNSKAPATAPADDTEHNSDYWVWFSIYDTKAGATVTDATVSGATGPNADGYYYAPSGSAISVQMKDGWNLRFTNLPSKTTYTFVEGDLDDGFAFKSAELTQGTDSTFSGGQTTTGTIENTTTSYYVEYTNDYELTDLEITKVWNDANNQDGKRLTADELKAKLTLAPEVQGSEPTIVDNGDNTYTITYTGLPRYNNGQEVEYTVTESKIDGYETTGSPAKDHGTITNKHTPEVTTVTVVKAWDDSDDIGGIRPASIQAQLKAGNTASGDPITLNEDNNWTYTWENLPKYSEGEEIVYTADETAVPTGYEKTGPVKTTADDGTITFTVTNTYNPTPVSVDPPVQKIITGNDDLYNGGDFTFTIAATSPADAPMPKNTSITNSAEYELQDREGFYEFGVITFTKPGTYTYTVTESGQVDGVENDKESTKTLTFTVEDDGEGNLTVTPTTDQVQLSFTNVYNADGEASIVVSKEITGAAWPAGKTLTLTIAGANGAPMPETTTATLSAASSVTFGPIAYALTDAGKTYTYTITESNFGAGWSGSPESITAVVEVSDNKDGTLGTTVTYTPENAKFTNAYTATGTATIEATKAIEGAAWPSGKTITFTLAGTESAPMPAQGGETVTLSEAGKATFGEITYTQADAGKTYTYTISEDGFGDGWTGSGDITATVVVTDNGDGTLATAVTYSPEDATITNTYEAEGEATLEVTKALAGAAWPEGKTLTLTLAGAENAPMPETTTATLTAAGSVSFGPIAYTEAHAGKTYTYTISEDGFGDGWTGSGNITATVVVTDNGDGTLGTNVTYTSNATITNTYVAEGSAVIEATKAIEGAAWPEGKKLTFTLAGADNAPMPETTTFELTAAGKATFGPIEYTEADAGKTYTYTISEDGFGKGWTGSGDITATVEVKDNGDGTLDAVVTYSPEDDTITNTYKAAGEDTIEVTKELVGAAWPEGKTLTFTITGADNAPMPETTTFELKEAGTATFGPIAYTEADAGKTYEYTISEGEGSFGDGWTGSGDVTATVVVTDNGDGTLKTEVTYSPENATITNTYKVEPIEVSFPVKKELIVPAGLQGPESWSYAITVAANDGAPSAETMSGTVTQESDTVTFGPITIVAPGEYTYTVTESGDVAGVANDPDQKTVTVSVVDNGNGTMTATVSSTEDSPVTFTNTYSAKPAEITFPVKKVLSIPEGLKGPAEWSYDISVSGTPAAETMQGTVNQNNNTVTFGPFTFNAPGEYSYTVTESGTVIDVINDPVAEKNVTVTVEDNRKGELTATVSTADSPLTFTNTVYKSEGSATISGTKRLYYTVDETAAEESESEEETEEGNKVVLDNTDGTLVIVKESEAAEEEKDLKLEGGEFTFEIHYAKDPNKTQLATASNGASGDGGAASFTFPTFTYTNEDLKDLVSKGFASRTSEDGATVFTVEYAITELASQNPAMQPNTQTFTVVAKFTDNGQGTMTPSYSGDINFEFKNRYVSNVAEVDLNGLKVMEGNRGLAGGEFTFTVSGDGPMPESTTATNDAGGAVKFGTIKFNKASIGDNASATFTYNITEQAGSDPDVTYDASTRTVTVTVTDDGEGHITATTNPGTAPLFTFTNQYTPRPGSLSVTKVVTGEDADLSKSFNFTVTLEDASISGTYGDMTFNGGVAQFSLTNGQTMTATGLPAHTPYTVTEADYSADFYDTTPSENASGTIPVAETAAVTFTNHFMDVIGGDLVAPTGTKYFENGTLKDGEFSFQIKDESGSVVSTGTNDAAGNITFSHIAYGKESLAGAKSKTFHYTVSEVIPAGATAENDYTVDGVIYDTSIKNISVEVKRVEGGQIDATLTSDSDVITFTNEGETIEGKTVSVLKAWEDEKGKSLSWPKNAVVVVELLADGTPTGKTATLTADSPSATFTDLDESVLVYSVRENSAKGVDGKFEVSISGSETEGFTVTNTMIPPETTPQTEPPTGINTGDNTPILPYLATLLGALLIAITAGMGFGLKRRSR